jgi:hypothetical protein
LSGSLRIRRTIKQDIDVESARDIFALIETVLPDESAAEKEVSLKEVMPDAILFRELMHGKGHIILTAHTRMNEEILISFTKD